jgi:transcriptional regulator GlxA family with amidase domain
LPRRSQVWSYCAGVPLAAAAGILDGHRATATWWLQPLLAQRYLRVRWQSASAVADGRIVTAAGPGGYLPLLLDRLGELYGGSVLRDVQNVLVLPLPRKRHAAFEAVEVMSIRDPALRRLLLFARRTPAQALDLAAAAEHMNVSVRTLCRRLKNATGVPAGDWLRRVKLSQVGEALRHTRVPVKSICDEYGFGSEASLHRAFKDATGLTPSAYRQAYSEAPPAIAMP